MKTSIEIGDSLFVKAKKLAKQKRISLRALIEEGLRHVIANKEKDKNAPQSKILTFGGDGLTDEYKLRGLNWETLRDEIYRGHGS